MSKLFKHRNILEPEYANHFVCMTFFIYIFLAIVQFQQDLNIGAISKSEIFVMLDILVYKKGSVISFGTIM